MSVNWLLNNCRRYEASLSLLAADSLPEEDREQVLSHFAKCENCRAKFAELEKLARSLTETGGRLPEVEAPVALRRRWVRTVRESMRGRDSAPRPCVPTWLSGRRLAWGSLAATWMLVLFFRFSAPDAPRPVSVAAAPASFRELLTALKVDQLETRRWNKGSPPGALPPRSQRPNAGPTKWEAA